MDVNAIILELLNRIQVLEKKVEVLEGQRRQNEEGLLNRPSFPTEKIGDKYRPLAEYLYEKWDKKIILTYSEIEEILGFPLPKTAHNYPHSFWANTETHSYAFSWLAIGYKAKVEYETRTVIFERNLY